MLERESWIVFLFAGAWVFYVIAGYPLLLAWRARRPRTVRAKPYDAAVTVLLPVHDGERWIEAKLRSILALDYPRELLQVLVLSDGSGDRTEEIASGFANQRVEVLHLPRGGKAAALNAGMARAHGDILFFTDIRQPLERSSVRRLVDCFADPEVGAASGELIILAGENREQANVGLYWEYEKWMRKRLSRIDSVLGATGAIYAMRRALAKPIDPATLLDDVALPLQAFFAGYRVVFEQSAVAYDYPASLEMEFRRKVRTLAGVYQLMRLYPALLGTGNRMWLDFVSHKLGRLTLPFALLIVMVSSFFLPRPWMEIAVGGQAAWLLLAAIDGWVPERALFKRLSSPARTFTVLLAAALCAVSIFFVPAKVLWKPTR